MSSTPSAQQCRLFSLKEILSATNNFDDSLIIGKGGFGKVYKGFVDIGGSTVAMKRLNPLSKQGAPEFWAEINMLSRFRHIHLVSLIGYCNDSSEMVLVYEYMVHGTLADHLYKISKTSNDFITPLSWVKRLKICIGAARGLDYLHTGTAILQRVIHRDVKSSNILLDENWAAKISDFGLSRIGPADQDCTDVTTKHITGTFGYMDPDYFLTRRFTRKSDVYAFGVVLLEVICERPALDRSLLDEDQWGLAGWGQHCIKEGVSHQLIGSNLKWEIFPDSLKEFLQIVDECLHSRPKKRPSMSVVVAKLENALALQLRTNISMDDNLFDTYCPFGSDECIDSYPEGNQIVQLVNSSNTQLFPFETPLVDFENPVAQSKNDSCHNSMLVNKDGGFIQDVPTTTIVQIPTPNLKIFKFDELKKATDNFKDVLGEGGFGIVYKGWVHEKTYLSSKVGVGKAVAVKRLGQFSSQGLAEGMMEVEILGQYNHPFLVNLLGYYCSQDDNEFLLVYEYMQNGTLNRHLFGEVAEPLPWQIRLKIAIEVAQGLSFIHATENHFIHHDISSSNIFLDGDFNGRLSGFGLAKRGPQNGDTHLSTRVMGTYGYADPEYIATGHLCVKSDIYGFGAVLLEILTGRRVFDTMRPKGEQNLVDWVKHLLNDKKKLKSVVDPRLENNYPRKGAIKLGSLIQHCLENERKNRPSMKQVLQSLENIYSIQMNPEMVSDPARHSTQRDRTAYKFLRSWTHDLWGSKQRQT